MMKVKRGILEREDINAIEWLRMIRTGRKK